MGLMRRILRCRRGTVLVEAAVVLPALLILLLGMVEISKYLEVTRKTMSATQTAADLVAQEAFHDDESLRGIRAAATEIMKPLSTNADNLTLTIASVGFDANKNTSILWQQTFGNGTAVVKVKDAEGLGDANESVIIVALGFVYESPFGFLITSRTLHEKAIARPRTAQRIALNGSTG